MSTLSVIGLLAAFALVWIVGIITGAALAGIWKETRLIKQLERPRQSPELAHPEVLIKAVDHEMRPTMH